MAFFVLNENEWNTKKEKYTENTPQFLKHNDKSLSFLLFMINECIIYTEIPEKHCVL